MSGNLYTHDDDIEPIYKVEFNILGNDEIRRISALGKDSMGIENSDLYDNLEPKKGGLIDTRLGPCDNHIDCGTCGLDTISCNGHPGHIVLAEYMFHIGYLNHVKKILSSICLKCSKLRVHKNEEEILDVLKNKKNQARFNEIRNVVKNVSYCQKPGTGCGIPTSKIKKDIKKTSGEITLIAETNISSVQTEEGGESTSTDTRKKIRQIITPEDAYNILSNISDIDCKILGFEPSKARPEMMIIKTLLVPPVQVRPSVKAEFTASGTKEDDLTHKLSEIIRANVRIRKYKDTMTESSSKSLKNHTHLLQYHVASYYDNDSCSSQKSGAPIKSVTSRLKSKEGRIRLNLMGKRVDFSARTVITSDPTIDINELRVPKKVAMNLTFPEVVTPYNIEKLQQLVNNGRDIYPGANYVFPNNSGGKKKVLPIDLRFKKTILKFGDVVERHLINGDYVLLNRQPTLHKLSMMAHKIIIIDNQNLLTFGLSPAVTTPYNADFDGDEMNIFVPQSIQTKIELSEIADVQNQIISPRVSTPIIGVVQDGVLGAYNLTAPSMSINWKDAMNIISYTTLDNFSEIKKNKDMKGSDLFSLIIPDHINIKNQDMEIKNGTIVKGKITSGQIGAKKPNSIIHLIWDEYGPMETKKFIDNTQKLINNFNLLNGFTVGIGDLEIPEHVEQDLTKFMETKKIEIKHMITEMENNPEHLDYDVFEESIYSNLNNIREEASKMIMKNLKPDNNFYIMISSGSKGGPINMGQMLGCCGQQAVDGSRIKKNVNGRTLHYFHKDDDTAPARGFVQQSFYKGMDPISFIFHNMGSREGLIDTAIKTADSGYMQRKLMKALEDVMIVYDMTVRNANNSIIQFSYGDNGIDPTKQYSYVSSLLASGNKTIIEKYKYTNDELSLYKSYTDKHNDTFIDMLIQLRDDIRNISFKTSINRIVLNKTFMLPINYFRIIHNSKYKSSKIDESLDPLYIIQKIEDILSSEKTMLFCMSKTDLKNKQSMKNKDSYMAKTLLRFSLYENLAPRMCTHVYKYSKEQFDNVVADIIKSFNSHTVSTGEMVGAIAAQSLGEPLTQMTLNTFHSAGIGGKGSTTSGVPRIKELFSFTKNIKTPSMILYVTDDLKKNRDIVERIASSIEKSCIRDIRDRIDVYYDPNPFVENGFMESDNVKNVFHNISPSKYACQVDISSLPWLVRIAINKEKMMNRDITLLDIKSKFCSYWEKRFSDVKNIKKEEKHILDKIINCSILSNNDNDNVPVIHIRFDMKDFNYGTITAFIDNIIENFQLKGITGINRINGVVDERYVTFDDDMAEKTDSQYVIYTAGVNMTAMRYINGIDLNKSKCNDIIDIYDKLGVEAARMALLKECETVYGSDNYVNYQHLSVLVDNMTCSGSLITIDRHAIGKIDADPFSRASFEKTVDQFIQAAIFSEVDHMKSVSSRIMAGLAIKGGTGLCDILLDYELLEKSEYVENTESKYVKTFNKLSSNVVMNDVLSKSPSNIFIPE